MTMPTRISKRGGGGEGGGLVRMTIFVKTTWVCCCLFFSRYFPVGNIIVPKVTKSFCAYVTSVSEKTTTQEYG